MIGCTVLILECWCQKESGRNIYSTFCLAAWALWRKLQIMIVADLFPKSHWCCNSFKTDMRKTRQQHRSWKSRTGQCCGEVSTTPPAWKHTDYRLWLGRKGGKISGSENCRSLPSQAKMSAQNERSKQKAGEEEKIIGQESSRCVSGCSPATRSWQEHHFQFLNSSQQTVIVWHISPLSGLSFFPHMFCPSLTGLPVAEKVPLRKQKKNLTLLIFTPNRRQVSDVTKDTVRLPTLVVTPPPSEST